MDANEPPQDGRGWLFSPMRTIFFDILREVILCFFTWNLCVDIQHVIDSWENSLHRPFAIIRLAFTIFWAWTFIKEIPMPNELEKLLQREQEQEEQDGQASSGEENEENREIRALFEKLDEEDGTVSEDDSEWEHSDSGEDE